MIKRVSVFCSACTDIDQKYFADARLLASLMIKNEIDLVYGGGKMGLMGAVSLPFREEGKRCIGVVPQIFSEQLKNIYSTDVVTEDLRERKEKMHTLSDGFIALAGGFGTLDEIVEAITLKQLKVHKKPIVFVNTNGFYYDLIGYFGSFIKAGFADSDNSSLYYLAQTPKDAIDYLKNYKYTPLMSKIG